MKYELKKIIFVGPMLKAYNNKPTIIRERGKRWNEIHTFQSRHHVKGEQVWLYPTFKNCTIQN